MNRVSDAVLAIAVNNSGCCPSLVPYKIENNNIDKSKFEQDYRDFFTATQSHDIVIALEVEGLLDRDVMAILAKYKPKCVELLDLQEHTCDPNKLRVAIITLKKLGIAISVKVVNVYRQWHSLPEYIDAVTIKGADGAGRVAERVDSLESQLCFIKQQSRRLFVIASGGVSSAEDVKLLIDAGADMVSVGTIFAVSSESSMSTATKEKIISSSYSQVEKIGTAKQNALVFAKTENDDTNNTLGLGLGVKDPSAGHVYVGRAIDTITEIRPVADIVKDLTSQL